MPVTGGGRDCEMGDPGRRRKISDHSHARTTRSLRLFSPQTYFQQETNPGGFSVNPSGNVLTLGSSTVSFACNVRSSLPAIRLFQKGRDADDSDLAFLREADLENTHLSDSQIELLRWH